MSSWENFLDDVFGHEDKPGKVMICFVNRNLTGIDDIKYKIKFDGLEKSGTTSMEKYCIEITPKSFSPIQTFVWSRQAMAYKRLDDVIPEVGRKKLVRKYMKTFKVSAQTEKLPTTPPVKRPEKPAAAPAPAPSPLTAQGITPVQKKNESNQPQAKVSRSIPWDITLEQLKKIFPAANNKHLQAVADECNIDLERYKLNTPHRRAHFFAQIRGETGPSMEPKTESWVYSPETLKEFSKYYRMHPEEARLDGYLRGPSINGKKGKIIRPSNLKAIGRKHFLNLNGNRLDHIDDGFDFRGRGLIQITGFEKYSKFSEQYSNFFFRRRTGFRGQSRYRK